MNEIKISPLVSVEHGSVSTSPPFLPSSHPSLPHSFLEAVVRELNYNCFRKNTKNDSRLDRTLARLVPPKTLNKP